MSADHSTTRDRGVTLTRVSDPKQSGASSQLTGCRRLAAMHNVEVVAEVNDDGVCGDDLDREGILETLAILKKAHKASEPITWLITDQSDRLSRADSLKTFGSLEEMRCLGIRKVATPTRIYDLYNALDRTMLSIEIDHKNNPFLKDLGRRVINGLLDAARQGYWTGQKPPFGYRVERTSGEHAGRRRRSGKLVIVEEEADIVRQLFQRYLDGHSVRDLVGWMRAKTQRRWSRTGVEEMLQRRLYTGVKPFGERTSGRHARLLDGAAAILPEGGGAVKGDVILITGYPVIVEPDVFARVQARLATGRSRAHKKGNSILPLSGLCRCGACGSAMHCADKHGHGYVICKNRKEADYEACPTSNHSRADEVLRRVLAKLGEELLEGDAVARLVELAGQAEEEAKVTWQADVEAARRSLEAVEKKLATARRRMAEEEDDELQQEYRTTVLELKQEKAEAEAEAARLRIERPAPEAGGAERLRAWLQLCRDVCQPGGTGGMDGPKLNTTLKELVAGVIVYPPRRKSEDAPRRPSKTGRRRTPSGARTVGRVEVELPDWLCPLLAATASCERQQGTRIILVSEPD